METLLESMLRRLSAGQEMSMELVTRRNLRNQDGDSRCQQVSFPGRTLSEGQKFARALLIIQLSHDALVSGSILTKRCIFYQHQDLFEKQRVVDELVDDIALTLEVHRHDLNIVASSKGLVSGPLTISYRDGSVITASQGDIAWLTCKGHPHTGSAIHCRYQVRRRQMDSSSGNISHLVILPVLGDIGGYPDLVTRSFLQLIHELHAEMPILVLTDFDPDGLNIFRCYRFGSDGTAHESAARSDGIRWLGVKARHIQDLAAVTRNSPVSSDGSLDVDSQPSARPAACRVSISSTSCRDPISLLTPRDRKLAACTLAKLSARHIDDPELERIQRELRVMLMMGVKAEIQWLDDAGNLERWLDDNIGPLLASVSR
ncbi:meiotic recombination protein rec12 [Ophiocordyceps sinensis CO18]|uniref:DNA topoisomerase (ATP-hydrolyzing) n=1 Tax=Ophiocordyceps sinensis (strain Co18 / CGMCC 3.14243) TaxID=911162 RepID=T5AF02_OPHSC|nr:meiotic recombination protein rec12 [Ophiocordyceps sinensis CO18]